MSVTILVVVAGLTHFGLATIRQRQATSRRAVIERYLQEGRAAEAVRLLPEPRMAASEDGQLARRVARALVEPVLAADADPSSGRATVEEAVALGDELVEKYEKGLPELLEVVDDPLRHLQARRVAFDLVEDAEGLSEAPMPDLARIDRALEAGAVAALDSPPDIAAAVEVLSHGIRARAVLSRARAVVEKRPEEARALLVKAAQRLPPAQPSGRHDPPPPDEPDTAPLLTQVGRIREAVRSRDLDALGAAVRARPDSSWEPDAREELDRELRRACQALGSLSAEKAAQEIDPEARAARLIAGMTCDEVLPRDFLAASRAALAETLVEAARRGGSLEDALLAWENVQSPRRDRDLAALACLAEARGASVTAVLAWSRVGSPAALALLARCGDEPVEAMPPPTLPSLDYPAPGT